ncbi:MAG: AraC family transcriptional regulator, partial [Spirochaetota bacterium]
NFFVRIGDNIHTPTSKCIVTGPTEKATFLKLSKKIDAIGIHFQPGGAYPFFQEEISNFTDKIIPMLTNDRWATEELYSSLKMREPINDKISVLDDFLLKKLQESTADPSLWVIQVVGIVRKHNGSLKIDELTKQLNITRRHFERRFKKEVGLSPKQFSRIVRIAKTRSLIRSLNFNSLTDVGYECNYYDQAHFIREFKAFVKETPKQYFQRKKQMSLLYNS